MTVHVTQTTEALVARLAPIGEISYRKMFGGCGIFESGKMFALVDSNGIAHLKVDESNLQQFEDAGCTKHSPMPYYSIPEKVLSNTRSLRSWARASIAISKG